MFEKLVKAMVVIIGVEFIIGVSFWLVNSFFELWDSGGFWRVVAWVVVLCGIFLWSYAFSRSYALYRGLGISKKGLEKP